MEILCIRAVHIGQPVLQKILIGAHDKLKAREMDMHVMRQAMKLAMAAKTTSNASSKKRSMSHARVAEAGAIVAKKLAVGACV